jgi:hypothetical protein
MANNPYPNANKKPSDLGNHLRQVFNLGSAPITQTPGAAHPSTRKFYSTHQGYDYGTPEGTAIRPNASGQVVQSYTDNAWGNRALIKLDNGESYFLSHLKSLPRIGAFNAGQEIAYTGGTPGSWGAGNTTGAHLDITPADQNAFTKFIRGVQSNVSRGKIDLASVFKQARQKYGNGIVAVSSNPQKLQEYAKKYKGGKIIRI